MSFNQELLQAVQGNRLSEVVRLLQAGADPNARQGKKSALDMVHSRRDDIRCALIEAGAFESSLLTALVWAVNTGRLASVQALIDRGADVNQSSSCGTPLQVAASRGHLEIADALLKAGADVSAGSALAQAIDHGHTLLALLLLRHGAEPQGLESAAALGQVEVVTALLQAGAPVDPVCPLHRGVPLVEFTPLHAASQAGQLEMVELLLEAGADPHRRDGQGHDALQLATPEVLERLRQRALVSRCSPEEALLAAAETGDPEAVQIALAAHPLLVSRDLRRQFRGFTALHLAAHHGHEQALELLLQAVALPDATDADSPKPGLKQAYSFLGLDGLEGEPLGRTPLFCAAQSGHQQIVDRLLQAGAEVNRQDFLGFSPLFLAAERGHREVVARLLQAGANLDLSGPHKTTPLLVALENGQRHCAKRLLQAGASLKASSNGTTPMMQAAENADAELIGLMLQRKARLTGSKGCSPPLARVVGATRQVPIDQAPPGNWVKCWTGAGGLAMVPFPEPQILEAMEVLLEAGADPNAPGTLGTPLMVAARQGLTLVLQRLLQAGADPALLHGENTALSLARLFGHSEVVQILEKAAAPLPAPVEPEPVEPEPEVGCDRELPQPDFSEKSQQPEFQQVVSELERICGSRAVAKDYLRGGFELHVHSDRKAEVSSLELQARFLEQGCFVFEPYYHDPQKLAVVPCTGWSQVIALMQTNGVNCGVYPHDVVDWMEQLYASQPFVLRSISHDTLAGDFLGPIADPKGLAQKMYEFCPDIVDQGCQSVAALAKELQRKPARLFFWWD